MLVNGATETIEVERKYDVAVDAMLPDASNFESIGLRSGPAELFELRARYFDTPMGDLAAKKVAVRSRDGGKDAGWHMKLKGKSEVRELSWPASDEMPDGLLKEIADRLGIKTAARVGPIAALETQRMTLLLLNEADAPVIEVADDRVDALNVLSGRRQQWREWETELMVGADQSVLDDLEPLLIAAGATRLHDTSKIQRTMRSET